MENEPGGWRCCPAGTPRWAVKMPSDWRGPSARALKESIAEFCEKCYETVDEIKSSYVALLDEANLLNGAPDHATAAPRGAGAGRGLGGAPGAAALPGQPAPAAAAPPRPAPRPDGASPQPLPPSAQLIPAQIPARAPDH